MSEPTPEQIKLPKVRVRGFDRLFSRLEEVLGVHGETCQKVPHTHSSGGYLHAADDDRPYDVDGLKYCGRCHRYMS